MNKGFKAFKEEIARAKNYYHRHEVLRSMISFATAMRTMFKARLMGRDKTEASGALREMTGLYSRTEEVKKFAPNGLRFVPGKEKQLLMQVVALVKKVQGEMVKESQEEARRRKLKIDRLLIRAEKHLEHKKISEAEEAFQEAVSLYVDEHKLYFVISSKLLKADYPRQALKYLHKGLEVDPEEEHNYRLLAEAHEKLGDLEKAEKALKDSLAKFGDDFRTWVQYGNMLLRAKRLKEALEAAKKAIDLDPTHPDAKTLVQKLKKLAAKSKKS